MAQILDSVPSDTPSTILCCYVNGTGKIQVARITNIPNWYFERVVFPGQRLIFETAIEGQLEIHSGSMASSILEDTIPCNRLQMVEPEAPEAAINSSIGLAPDAATVSSAKEPMHANG